MPLPATQTVPAWYSTTQLFNIIGELVKSTPSSPQPITVTPEGSFTLDTLYNLDGSPAPNPLPTAVDIASGIAGGADPNGNLQFGASAGFKDLWSGGTYIGTVELSAADVDTVHRSGNETIAGTKTFTSLPSVPVLPVNPGDVASKSYVDTYAIAGAYYKSEVQAATTVALPANTYAAGPQTLTANANGALPAQDGYAPVVGDSLLVKNEAAGANNGIYTVTSLGSGAAPWVLTRRSDASTGAALTGGAAVYVLNGTVLGGTTWIQTTKSVTIGTTAQVWVQASASGAAPIGPAGGVLSGSYPNPALAASSLGGSKWNAADPLPWSNVSGVPADLPVGSGVSVHSLGPLGGQAAPGPGQIVRHKVGAWHLPPTTQAISLTLALSSTIVWLQPLLIERPITIDQLAITVTAVSAPSNTTYMGLYSVPNAGIALDNGDSCTLLAGSAGQALTTTGNKTFTITPQALAPGFYLLGLGYSFTSGSITVGAVNPIPSLVCQSSGPTFNGGCYSFSLPSGGMPNPAAVTTNGGGQIPCMSYHVSAMT